MRCFLNNTTAPGTGGYRYPTLEWEAIGTRPDRGGGNRLQTADRQMQLPRYDVVGNWPMRGSITGTAIVVDNLVTIDPRIWYSHHGHAPYRITGTVKNSVGAAIGGAKLLLFQSTGHNSKFGTEAANGPGQGVNDALQATVSTGAGDAQTLGGYGFVVLDNTTPHYIVAESSDGTLVGTTVKTLVGS